MGGEVGDFFDDVGDQLGQYWNSWAENPLQNLATAGGYGLYQAAAHGGPQQPNGQGNRMFGPRGNQPGGSPYDGPGAFGPDGFPQRMPWGDQSALAWQFEAERIAQQRRETLFNDARGALSQGANLLSSYRPGGAAALASGMYQGQANVNMQQAMTHQAPDLLMHYRHRRNEQARQDAKDSQKLGAIMGLAGMGASAAGAAIGAPGAGAGLTQAGAAMMQAQPPAAMPVQAGAQQATAAGVGNAAGGVAAQAAQRVAGGYGAPGAPATAVPPGAPAGGAGGAPEPGGGAGVGQGAPAEGIGGGAAGGGAGGGGGALAVGMAEAGARIAGLGAGRAALREAAKRVARARLSSQRNGPPSLQPVPDIPQMGPPLGPQQPLQQWQPEDGPPPPGAQQGSMSQWVDENGNRRFGR